MTGYAHKQRPLTEADHALIAEAKESFRSDFRYLESLLKAGHENRKRRVNMGITEPITPPIVIEAEPEPAPVVVPTSDLSRSYQDLNDLLEIIEEPRLADYLRIDKAGCWIWEGGFTGSGQAVLRLGPDKKVKQVRRFLYEAVNGEIEKGRRVLSEDACHVHCMNPEHAFVLVNVRTRSHRT